jgi:formate hydrogenlyase subunit 3/multisubunit Na+/H+ antiporter MnhD subunit
VIAWTVLVPLAGATLALGVGARLARGVGVATGAATTAVALLAVLEVRAHGVLVHELGGWGAPLGIVLQADGLSAVFVATTAAVGIAVTVHAARYFAPGREATLFWPLWLFLWAALDALFLTRDVFNVYVTLELTSLAAVGLVAIAGGEALTAALRYLLVALAGSLAYLLGVALVYAAHGTLDAEALRAVASPGGTAVAGAAAALVTGGLAVKGALFPLHGWLPPAHGGAPAPVSAALSALVVKTAFYLLVRWLSGGVFAAGTFPAIETLLGVLGAGAVGWGSWQALRAERLKQLVAFSTVAQLGYLFLYFPLARAAGPGVALGGAVLLASSHALAKAAMFLAAGAVLHATGSDRLCDLPGTGRRMPLVAAALALGGVNLMGLPFSGGFAGKWVLLSAALRAGAWPWAAVLLVGGLLAAGYVFRVLERVFASGGGHERAPAALQGAALALAIGAVALGVFPGAVLDLLARGAR